MNRVSIQGTADGLELFLCLQIRQGKQQHICLGCTVTAYPLPPGAVPSRGGPCSEGLALMAPLLKGSQLSRSPKPLPGLSICSTSATQSRQINNLKHGEWQLRSPLLSNLDIPASQLREIKECGAWESAYSHCEKPSGYISQSLHPASSRPPIRRKETSCMC